MDQAQELLVIPGPCQNKGGQKPVVAHFRKEVDTGHKQDQTQQHCVAAQEPEAFSAGFSERFFLLLFGAFDLWDPDEKQQNGERREKAAKVADQNDLQTAEGEQPGAQRRSQYGDRGAGKALQTAYSGILLLRHQETGRHESGRLLERVHEAEQYVDKIQVPDPER